MPKNRPRVIRLIAVLLAGMVLCAQVAGALPANPNSGLQTVIVPVANMYAKPSRDSELVSQAIYGSNVVLVTASGEWSRIETPDHYRGWVQSRHLRIVQSGSGYATAGQTVQVKNLSARLYRENNTQGKPLLTIPFESRLEVIEEGKSKNKEANWIKLHLPDKTTAWIRSSDVASDSKPLTIPESVELAKRFLGVPYLWGGTSSFAFDCSGFTQMLMRARGVNIPRDADQQAAWNGLMPVERKDLQAGDLLFFGSTADKIDHTGMYIGDGLFIHDTTNGQPGVQVSRLDDDPWTHLLVASRRAK